jgi:PAS domain S-box-containing protein
MGKDLRASEDRFRSIFSAAGEGIFIVSPSTGAFTEINEAGCAMFGYAADELIGRDLQTLSSLAGCEFQAPQKCLRLIKVYAINFIA